MRRAAAISDGERVAARAEIQIEVFNAGIIQRTARTKHTGQRRRRLRSRIRAGIAGVVQVHRVRAATVDGEQCYKIIQRASRLGGERVCAEVDRIRAAAGVDARRDGCAREIDRVVAGLGIDRQIFDARIIHRLRAERHRAAGDANRIVASRAVGDQCIRAAAAGVADRCRERATALEINIVSVIATFAVQRHRAAAGPTVNRKRVCSRTTVEAHRVDAVQRDGSIRAVGGSDDIAIHHQIASIKRDARGHVGVAGTVKRDSGTKIIRNRKSLMTARRTRERDRNVEAVQNVRVAAVSQSRAGGRSADE